MAIPNISLANRKFAFSLAIVLLLSVFFSGYYFYFIPRNSAGLHNDGFLVLKNIQTNIQERNEDLEKLYQSYFNRNAKEGGAPFSNIQHLLTANNIAGKVGRLDTGSTSSGKTIRRPVYKSTDSGIYLTRIDKGNLIYLPDYYQKDSIAIILSIDSLLGPVLSTQKDEFFESYVLIQDHKLIYKDPELGISTHIQTDSLFQNNKAAALAGIRDIRIEDIDYKMFYYPFNLRDKEIILCGFVRSGVYNHKLNTIPVSFIYPIAIIFLLLLIFMPLLKFYIMGRGEQVRFMDLSLSSLSLFAGMTLLTLIIIQVMLLMAANIRTRENLGMLANQIDSHFTSELVSAYHQLDRLDSCLSNDLAVLDPGQMRQIKDSDVSGIIKKYFPAESGNKMPYYHFDRVAWVDSSGRQLMKGQLSEKEPLFTNVSARKYFEVFRSGQPYMLPGQPEARFGFEPVNTWTNGEFSMIISKQSRVSNSFITSMSAKMYSVTHTILPPGYGFCIIDGQGKVLLHAQMNRNLQENILEKTGQTREIKEAMTARQYAYFSSINFYGKTNAANIRPIAQTPFFLITYYDQGYIFPINMRILIFSFLFCQITYLICALIWFLFLRKRYYSYPLLYAPISFINWAIPKQRSVQFYRHGTWFLLVYGVTLLLSIVLSSLYNSGNFVPFMGLLTPVNVIAGLFTISHLSMKGITRAKTDTKKRNRQVALGIMTHLVVSILSYAVALRLNYRIEPVGLWIQCCLNLLLWIYYFSSGRHREAAAGAVRNYMGHYATFVTLIIIALAVLPAALYTFYAHNQELIQSVKKEQLFLARSLEDRRQVIARFTTNQQPLSLPPDYYEWLQYQNGIYRINGDSISWNNTEFSPNTSYEPLYFSIANKIGNNYYDPLLFPSLKDYADNSEWKWSVSNNDVRFRYLLDPDENIPRVRAGSGFGLDITSVRPARYKIIGVGLKGMLLFLFIGCLILGLYILIRTMTERLFLIKYKLAVEHPDVRPSIEAFFPIYALRAPVPLSRQDALDLEDEFNYFQPGGNDDDIYRQEHLMLNRVEKYRSFYDFIWEQCTDKEKYLLFDLAKDGLLNYKNAIELYHMIDRGLLILHDEEIKVFSPSFRAYILTMRHSEELQQIQKKFLHNSSWQAFRVPILLVLFGTAAFIFFTQEETFQRIIAMVAGISSVGSIILKLFVDGQKPAAKPA